MFMEEVSCTIVVRSKAVSNFINRGQVASFNRLSEFKEEVATSISWKEVGFCISFKQEAINNSWVEATSIREWRVINISFVVDAIDKWAINFNKNSLLIKEEYRLTISNQVQLLQLNKKYQEAYYRFVNLQAVIITAY